MNRLPKEKCIEVIYITIGSAIILIFLRLLGLI